MTNTMLSRLRLKLTALYFAATIGFLVLIGAITYGLISYYSQSTTDLVLRLKMAYEYQRIGLPVPLDLQLANQEWNRLRGHPHEEAEDEDFQLNGLHAGEAAGGGSAPEDELAAVFVMPLDEQGRRIVTAPGVYMASFQPDVAAIQAAEQNGSDFRTIRTAAGVLIRLYTYRLPRNDVVAILQIGRVLTDQEVLLKQLLTGLLILGGAMAVLATLSSWWLAGRALRPAQLAWERQRSFVANASHELRTPLSLIQLSAEVAARDDTTDVERRELATDVLRESQYMARLVGDLLLLSRLDTGQLHLELQPVDVPELLEEVRADVARLADPHGITLKVKESHGSALAERTRLRQLLLNLLDNALRHTPDGGQVTLEVE